MNLQEEFTSREEIATHLHYLRNTGDLTGAIAFCHEAARLFPNHYFYPQIASDLHFKMQEYDAAAEALLECLRKLPGGSDRRFAGFARRYNRLRRVRTEGEKRRWAGMVMSEIKAGHLDEDTGIRVNQLIQPDLPSHTELSEEAQALIPLLSSDIPFQRFVNQAKRLQVANSAELAMFLDLHVLNRTRNPRTFRVDEYCLSAYEKMGRFDSALNLAQELLLIRLQGSVIRSVFRICRNLGDYRKAEQLLAEHPSVLKSGEFNVLYELVYYFEAQNDIEQAQAALTKMEKRSASSLPILKTLKNFYTRFGMVDDVVRVNSSIEQLQISGRGRSTKFRPEVEESEAAVPSKIQELYSELEHQTRLAAISDLTTGISHELGQPITNIRYTVQFHRKMLDRKYTKEAVSSAFDSILEETERMGGLMKRLSPLTSGRSAVETFDIVQRIRKRVGAEKALLFKSRIEVTISPEKPVFMHADPVRFDQIVGNLLLNAIDAITERKGKRRRYITIQIREDARDIKIVFADTGVGIPLKNRGKLFDPFFSTKAPGKGEGLGLFIVWNLLKMQGGKIVLDSKYKNGARFHITIPKNTNDT